jgi:HEAT repeats
LRSAEVLSRFEDQLPEILNAVMKTGDEYALQAFVSQIERVGAVSNLIESLVDPRRKSSAQAALLALLRSGAHRMLLDALAHHVQPRVRAAVARTVAHSQDQKLLPQLEELLAHSKSPRHRRVVHWTLRQLETSAPSPERPSKVPA